MPRERIDIPHQIDYLSILDEHGKLDKALEPDIPDDILLKMHRTMLLSRRFDERLLNLQRQGRIGTFAPSTGQEAAHIGTAAVLRPNDWMVPSYRETSALLWRGAVMEGFLVYFAGFDEGGRVPDDVANMPISIPVGSQTLHAAGLGYAIKYRKRDQVVMAYFGDGATSQGDFHEALNFSGVFQLPVVFVCNNNHWAISVPRYMQTRSETIAQKALAYGISGIQVDGNDVLAVYSASREAVERARSGGGATLIENVTYRVIMHTTADDPKRYRTEKEVALWKERDPIPRFQSYLMEKGLLTREKIDALEAELKDEIQGAVDKAEQQIKVTPDPLHMFEHMYAEFPPTLGEHKEELARDLAENEKESSHA